MQATLMINREDAVVVDVREAAEYGGGHIPNSRHIPAFAVRQAPARAGEVQGAGDHRQLRQRQPLVLGLQRDCASAGFAKVFNLSGGISAWDQAGLPITKK
jgi:rhodanese-related sulfurtransferase